MNLREFLQAHEDGSKYPKEHFEDHEQPYRFTYVKDTHIVAERELIGRNDANQWIGQDDGLRPERAV